MTARMEVCPSEPARDAEGAAVVSAASQGIPCTASREGPRPHSPPPRAPLYGARSVRVLPGCEAIAEPIASCYDIHGLLARVAALRLRPGVRAELLGESGGWPLWALHLGCRPDLRASGSPAPRLRVVITAGVHGVEPAGPAAALLFAAAVLSQPHRFADISLAIVPLVNPYGYTTQTRGDRNKIDLNRCFSDDVPVPVEVAAVRRLLRRHRYDLGIDLHSSRSSGERGFFVLHRGAREILVPAIQRFAQRYPVLRESTDRYVIEGPGILRSCNNGTLKDYLGERGTRWSLTIEAPAVWPYEAQVLGTADLMGALVESACDAVGDGQGPRERREIAG